MKNIFKLITLSLLILVFTGCARTLPIHNVENQAINYDLSNDKIEKAILQAGIDKRWMMKVVEPGKIEAYVLVRSHRAEVNITYNEKTYSITYKDSQNLLYKDGKIHRNYNKWVILLDRQIQLNLNAAS